MLDFHLLLVAGLALFVAWNLGANDVANSMGTSVGSKALSLKQALTLAGILELIGAVAFSQAVASSLATEIANPALFARSPETLLLGMVAVLLTCGLWLQGATRLGLPVASSHAVVGAIAGFSWVAAGPEAVRWGQLGQIALAWVLTPLVSGAMAALFYAIARRWILTPADPIAQLREWIPWLSAALFGIFGVVVLPTVFARPVFACLPLPPHSLSLATGSLATLGLAIASWKGLERAISTHESSADPKSQIQVVEKLLGRFQVASACSVAFAHGSNDVGNAIAPLAAIVYILQTNTVPLTAFPVPFWILGLGGIGIVAGLAVQGKNVIATVGEGIIALQPSSGFCAELATAATILLASRLGIPASTSHALVGAVVGIGLGRDRAGVRFSTLKSVILAWAVTLPVAVLGSAIAFSLLRWAILRT
jgi:PiT family inorganic phosphate transporter